MLLIISLFSSFQFLCSEYINTVFLYIHAKLHLTVGSIVNIYNPVYKILVVYIIQKLKIYGSDMMRKVFSVTFALIVLLSLATSVQALESKNIQRDNGASAFASWSETNGNLINNTYLSVTKSNDETYIYLDIYTWDSSNGNFVNDKSGSMFISDDIFSIDKKLNSASLSEVDVEVYNWDTGKMEILPVTADWTGIGDVSTDSYTSISTNGDYRFRSTSHSNYRDASATGSINNTDLGIDSYGSLVKFKSAYMNMIR